MPAILRSLQRLLNLLDSKGILYMIIGGYALPFYGRIRTTIDLDLAVAIRTEEEFRNFTTWMRAISFRPVVSSFQDPLIVIFDLVEKVEIGLWLRPDGVVFDDEVLKRRRKARLDESTEAWIVSPEDFIVNKLARPDRGVNDEQDVKSVLVRQQGSLDEEYLERRARELDLLQVLRAIQAQSS